MVWSLVPFSYCRPLMYPYAFIPWSSPFLCPWPRVIADSSLLRIHSLSLLIISFCCTSLALTSSALWRVAATLLGSFVQYLLIYVLSCFVSRLGSYTEVVCIIAIVVIRHMCYVVITSKAGTPVWQCGPSVVRGSSRSRDDLPNTRHNPNRLRQSVGADFQLPTETGLLQGHHVR